MDRFFIKTSKNRSFIFNALSPSENARKMTSRGRSCSNMGNIPWAMPNCAQ